jgi:hypothetical protein
MSCNLIKVHRNFGRIYCLHLQGRRVRQASNQQEASSPEVRFSKTSLKVLPKYTSFHLWRHYASNLPVSLAGGVWNDTCVTCDTRRVAHTHAISRVSVQTKVGESGMARPISVVAVRSTEDSFYRSLVFQHCLLSGTTVWCIFICLFCDSLLSAELCSLEGLLQLLGIRSELYLFWNGVK